MRTSVPMLVSSPKMSMGRMPPAMAQMTPVMMVVMCGVPKRGWIFAATGGKRPSCAIEKKMRGWPRSMTSMTDERPAMAPTSTANSSQPMPGDRDADRDGMRHRELAVGHDAGQDRATPRYKGRCTPPASRGCRWA